MKVKYRVVYILIIFIVYISFLFIKLKMGELTPDERLFISGQVPYDGWEIKYLLTMFIISSLYSINELIFPISLIIISVIVFSYAYKNELKRRTIGKYGLLIAFLLPSTIYFSTAYLRDIFLFLFTILLIYSYQENKIGFLTLLLLGLIMLFRPEAGTLILISFIIITCLNYRDKFIISINKYSTPIVLLTVWGLLFILLKHDYFWGYLYEVVNRFEDSTRGFSVLEVSMTKENVMLYGLVNWFAYYGSFLFKDSFSTFSYFMLLDSIIIGILFIRGIFFIKKKEFKYNKIYQVSYAIVLGTLFVSLPESVPETMYRHRMAYLPFLIYLNFYKLKR